MLVLKLLHLNVGYINNKKMNINFVFLMQFKTPIL